MKNLFTFLVLGFLLLSQGVSAQGEENKSLTGQITDQDSGEPILGAMVIVKSTNSATVSDIDGVFTLKNIKAGEILEFSYLGYQTRRLTVNENQSVLNIKLKHDVAEIDEVVVVGYGVMRKSDLTGSVASLKSSDTNQSNAIADVSQLIEGRVAGVQVDAGEGGPGMGVSISIRGASSIHANSQPLYVIDGFPVEAFDAGLPDDGFSGQPISPLSNIDPSNIESIEILKDASATAIYGSRGANGVIMITTKSGKQGKMQINANVSFGVSQVANKIDMLDSRGYTEYMYHRSFHAATNADPYAAERDESIVASGKCNGVTLQYPDYAKYQNPAYYAEDAKYAINTDWQDEMYQLGFNKNYSVTLSGGSETVQYNINGGYFSDEGILENSNFDRYTLDTKLSGKYSKKLKFDISTRLGHTLSNGVASGVGGNLSSLGITSQIVRRAPTKDLFDTINSENEDGVEEDLSDEDKINPYTFLRDVTNKISTTRILTNAAATYQILPELSYKASIGANINHSRFQSFYPSSTGKGEDENGISNMAESLTRSWVHESILTYNKTINKIHRLNVMGAFTAEEKYSEQTGAINSDFDYQDLSINNVGMGVDPSVPSSSFNKNQLASFLSRINYSLNNKYLVTLSIRADGSSRFGEDNKWAYFPSGSFAWRMNEEEWFKENVDWVNNFKWRVSYGVTGNQNIGDYSNIPVLGIDNYTFDGETVLGMSLASIGNPDLRWETTEQYNAGVDIGFLRNKISFTADVYYKKTSDMLMSVKVSNVTGYDEYNMNYGSIENKGLELALNAEILNQGDWRWSANGNMTFNRSMVLDLGNQEYLSYGASRVMVGQPLGTFWGYKQIGIIENQAEMALYNQEGLFMAKQSIGQRQFADIDSSTSTADKIVIDANDQTIIGCYEPDFYGGFSTNVGWKNLSLAAQFRYSVGGEVFNGYKSMLTEFDKEFNRHVDAMDYWDAETNPNSLMPHPSSEDLTEYIDVWVEDASYLKLSSLTLSYNFPRRIMNKLNMANLMVYVRGTDLFTITGYSGTDPQASMGGKLSPGYDKGGKPFVRTYSFGLNLGF